MPIRYRMSFIVDCFRWLLLFRPPWQFAIGRRRLLYEWWWWLSCRPPWQFASGRCWLLQVETVGDKYMLASGLPEKSSVHAKSIALVALDMLDIAREITVDGCPVKVHRHHVSDRLTIWQSFILYKSLFLVCINFGNVPVLRQCIYSYAVLGRHNVDIVIYWVPFIKLYFFINTLI